MASLVAFYTDEPFKPSEPDRRVHVEQHPIGDAQQFELGYPEPGVAYVRHPENERRLLPLADYHPQILIEKTNEAILMLTSLGARSIDLYYSNKISDQAKAEIELLFGIVTISGGKSKSEDTRVVYRARGEGSAPRALPPLLWIDQPGWRGIIEGRLHAGLREFSLSYTYDHRSGVDGELAARVRKFGLRAGGEFRKSHRVAFLLEGEFPDPVDSSQASD